MKKLIIGMCITLWIMALTSVVFADLDMSIGIVTDGEANIYVNPNSLGDTNYYIDGVNFENTIDDIDKRFEGRTFGMDSVLYKLGKILIDYDYLTGESKIQDFNKLTYKEQKFRNGLDLYIEYRLKDRDKYYNNVLNQMNLEIRSLQQMFNSTEICNAKLRVAKELDIQSVKCDDTVYINKGTEFITITKVKKIEKNETIKIIHKAPIIKKSALDRYQELCDKGLEKFCRIIEVN